MFDVIAFDADDTLWQNETFYQQTQANFADLLSDYCEREVVGKTLLETETRNIPLFGYGVKGFTLSMIETAIDLTEGKVEAEKIGKVIDLARHMLVEEIHLLDQVEATIRSLAQSYRLMIITKGDLFDQENKIARSGLADYFDWHEIVSEKNPQAYEAILTKYEIAPERFLMVGNSLKSDVLPVVAIGGQAVHIPYHTTWEHELVTRQEAETNHYIRLDDISQLPAWLTGRKRS